MKFPNGLVFDANGDLFVTDSMSGTIYKIAANGLNVAEWKKDALLAGDVASACASGLGSPLGANGLALSNGAFYVTNTDKATIIKIPVNGDGTAGAAEVFSGPDCATLKGLDGVTVDQDGSLIVAANSQNTILRVGMDGKSSVLTSGSPLQFPASVATAMVAGKRALFITNAAFAGMPQTPGLLTFPLEN
jgi:sugar lactone lactonase YvrE